MAFEHYDKCSLLLPMDGANNGTTFTDWSPNPKTVTVAGNAKTVTAQTDPFGYSNGVGYFDGSGDYLSLSNHADLYFSGDFTLSMWVKVTGGDNTQRFLYDDETVSSYGILFQITAANKLAFYYMPSDASNKGYSGNLANITSTSSLLASQNSWVHCGVSRSGTVLRLFVNGVLEGTASLASNVGIYNPGGGKYIGFRFPSSSAYFLGYISNVLIINGAALWTSDFTPPARLIGTLSGNVKDYAGTNAQRTIAAMPRTSPTRAFTTTSDSGTGNYTLRAPSVESSAILLANEPTLYNDLVHRVTPE